MKPIFFSNFSTIIFYLKNALKYWACVVFCLVLNYSKATHIVGGEIYYDNLGNNDYKIHMKVYRDCFNGIPPLDNPAFVTIYDASKNVVMTINMPLLSSKNVPPSINSSCIQAPNNVCVQEGIYEYTVNLPPKAGGYYIVYQRCCRNGTILNLVNPGNVGSTYWDHIPGPEVVAVNNCPRFNKFPPIFICNGIPIKFDHAATDPDGDSLVYTLCTPFNGLDGCCPLIPSSPPSSGSSSCPVPPATCPSVNTPPPYVSVPFITGYNAGYPLASSPVININSKTGFLNGVPNINGQWVVGVCVEEWRNGVLIGTHHRDFQFNVVSCIVNVVSAIQDQTQKCSGLNVTFNNLSVGGTGFYWNFGDPTTLGDTSNLVTPNYTYPDTGKYTVTLIANPGSPCADTSTKTFYVYPFFAPTFTAPPGQCIAGNSFSFSAAGQYAGYTNFNWTFGSSATPTAGTGNPKTNVVYNSPGTFPVILVAVQNPCTVTIVDSVTVYSIPQASFSSLPISACDPALVNLINLSESNAPANYLWTLSNGMTSTAKNPSFVITPSGVYNLTLALTTTLGCVSTSTFGVNGIITINPSPKAGFVFTPSVTTIFDPDVYFKDMSSGANSWYYSFGDGSESYLKDPTHSYNYWGDYPVYQIVTNQFGCSDTAFAIVPILPEFRFWIPNCFTPNNHDGLNDTFGPSITGIEEYEFSIYDRWGHKIFETNDPFVQWDGNFKGKYCQQDVYAWLISFKNLVSKRHEQHAGHVTLLR